MTYTLTDDEGTVLASYDASSYPGGAKGALKAAAMAAGRRIRKEKLPALLSGPDIRTRRYDHEYLVTRPTRNPYRVIGRCGHWAWPVAHDEQPERCWTCRVRDGSERQKAAVREANQRRKKSVEIAT